MPQDEGLRRPSERESSSESGTSGGDTIRRRAEEADRNRNRESSPARGDTFPSNADEADRNREREARLSHLDRLLPNLTDIPIQNTERQFKIYQILNNVKDALPLIYQQGNDPIVHTFLKHIDQLDEQKLQQLNNDDIKKLHEESQNLCRVPHTGLLSSRFIDLPNGRRIDMRESIDVEGIRFRQAPTEGDSA